MGHTIAHLPYWIHTRYGRNYERHNHDNGVCNLQDFDADEYSQLDWRWGDCTRQIADYDFTMFGWDGYKSKQDGVRQMKRQNKQQTRKTLQMAKRMYNDLGFIEDDFDPCPEPYRPRRGAIYHSS